MQKLFFTAIGAMAFATTAAAQNATAPGNPGGGVEEVVVTAQRRDENIQRTALSIQALSSEVLARANVTRAEDLTGLAPGVQVGTGGPFAQTYIRGVGNFSAQVFAEGAVAYNLDGVYISRPWAMRGMFYDLDRVEVLKGPQGTLYGRNASGGAINIITAKPNFDGFNGFAEIEAGNYDLIHGTAAINIPLSSTVAVRASGQVTSRSGYLSDGTEDDKTQSGRLQVLMKPNDDVSLLLSGSYQHIGGKGTGAALSPQLPGDPWRSASDPAVVAIIRAEPFIGPLLTVPLSNAFTDTTIYSIGAELNWDLGFGTLTVLPAYRQGELNDLHYAAGFHVENHNRDKQTSVEARLGNSSEKLKWVVGGYYFNERQTGLPGYSSLRVLQGITTQIQSPLDTQTKSYAAFGQATYSLTDRFRVTGGLRYTHEAKRDDESINFYTLPAQPPAPPGTCTFGIFDPTTPTPPTFCLQSVPIHASVTFRNVSYKAGVEIDVAPQSMAYANVSTGFKSGGFYSAPPPNTFKPEKLFAIDAGVKNRFLDNRLQLNVEAFYWRYKDHQETFVGPTSSPGFFTFQTVNAGRAQSYGADLEIAFRATQYDEMNLKVEYDKTRYNVFTFSYASGLLGAPVTSCTLGPFVGFSQQVDCSGKPLVRAPAWSGTAGYTHTFDLGASGSLDATFAAQFASGSYLSADFLQAARQSSYVLGNFDLAYMTTTKAWVVSAFVHNIGNEAVATQAYRTPFVSTANPLANPDGAIFATLRPPRTFGARVRYNF